MQLLLDTHAFIWAITADPRLGSHSRALITNKAASVQLSHVSLWEIAFKHALVRSDMPVSAAQAIGWAEASGFELLALAVEHILTLEQLPLHHRDPFDRLLVAQALEEELILVTADEVVASYPVPIQRA